VASEHESTEEGRLGDGEAAAKGPKEKASDSARAEAANAEPEATELEIDGCLDLHQFAPSDVAELVPAYLDECLARGITELRIVHGKGVGVLRTIVHRILERHPAVVWFGHASDAGSWGATVVRLEPRGDDRRGDRSDDGRGGGGSTGGDANGAEPGGTKTA
jgi:DNA-nicking Smr family endonuclease